MKKTMLTLLMLLGMGAATTQAQTDEWVDVTEAYIVNPSFSNNDYAGWTFTGSGEKFQSGSMEVYEQAFDLSVELNDIPNGHYRLSVQAYYRTGANSRQRRDDAKAGLDPVPAMLYANDDSQPLVNIYSEDTAPTTATSGGYWDYTENNGGGGWWDGGTVVARYPNDMTSGADAFSRDMYWQTLEFEVTDGTLHLGITNPEYVYYGWCMFDNFRLEYQGTVVDVTGISLEPKTASLVFGETIQLAATVEPENATFRKVTWTSDDPTIATVDQNGLVTAGTTVGTAYIYATTYDGYYDDLCEVTVSAPELSKDQFVFNEIMSGNVDQFMDETYNYDGWLELYNPTDQAASLAGLWLSDDATNLKKWHMPAAMGVVPAHGYKVIWFDNSGPKHPTQCAFNLDADGGTIYLSDTEGNLIVGQTYPEVITRMSYARTTDGGKMWDFTAQPTPGESNNCSEYTD
jgi:hypothetical protein